MIKKIHITMIEFQRLTTADSLGSDFITITKKQFEALESFVLSNELPDSNNYLKIVQYGNNKCLQAQNYIGVIQLKEGLTIEILPKIFQANNTNSYEKVRYIVIQMLKALQSSPFKQTNKANLKTHNMPLFEIFISMFMDSIELLIKHGIKKDYINKEENSSFYKGKLLFSEHIRHNLVHAERFYVRLEDYQANRIENRIIKTTLLHIYNLSRSIVNQQRIREALFVFDDIKSIGNVEVAFSRVKLNRQMKNYGQVLIWSRLFLLGDSFTPYKGNSVALALLFDMNKLFEAYVGAWFKKEYGRSVALQHFGYYLAQKSNKGVFALQPDIVVDHGAIIADTKWKLLKNIDKNTLGISQSDMYQMFAYASKYKKCECIVLIYPATEHTKDINTYYYFQDLSENKAQVPVFVRFFDLTKGFNQSFSLEA